MLFSIFGYKFTLTRKNHVVYLHAFRILVWAKNDLLMQKLYAIRPGVDALMRPGLEALMRLVVEARRLCSMKPSGRRW